MFSNVVVKFCYATYLQTPFPYSHWRYNEGRIHGWEMLSVFLAGMGPSGSSYYMTLTFSSLCETVEFIGLAIIKLKLDIHFLLAFSFPVNKKLIWKNNTKLSYVCNPLVALNHINPTSNHKQWIAYFSTSLNSNLLKQMNFVTIVGTIKHIFHPLSSCYELIYCFSWGYMILYQIIFMCILNSNMC